ncbi:MAG: phosphatase PAP2 family protein [Pseudomonadota bacterium]
MEHVSSTHRRANEGFWGRIGSVTKIVAARLTRPVVVPVHIERTLPQNPFFYAIVFVWCLIILHVMLNLDPGLAHWARDAPYGVRQFFRIITDLGTSGWILVTTGMAAIFLACPNLSARDRATRVRWANWHGDLLFVFSTVAVTGILASLIKNTIGRARPRHLDALGAYEFDFAAFTSGFASFPSGHSTTFGAFCACLCLLFPRATPVWVAFGITGGVSRMMVGAHYASDVIAGLLFGSVLTILFARWLSRRNILFVPVQAGHAFVPRRKRLPFPWA